MIANPLIFRPKHWAAQASNNWGRISRKAWATSLLGWANSGLDSDTAWSICTLLRKLASNGQAILCPIHQPSGILYQMFDRLLFLSEGRLLYFGDIGADLVSQEFATPFITQLFAVTRRLFQRDWRTPSYLWSKFFTILGLVGVFLYQISEIKTVSNASCSLSSTASLSGIQVTRSKEFKTSSSQYSCSWAFLNLYPSSWCHPFPKAAPYTRSVNALPGPILGMCSSSPTLLLSYHHKPFWLLSRSWAGTTLSACIGRPSKWMN